MSEAAALVALAASLAAAVIRPKWAPDWAVAAVAAGARRSSRRLLAMVFVAAAGTTAVLSLDATVVLLTPIVFATAARLRASSRPYVYACRHLANSASLLLPVSHLTNLLAFQTVGMSFIRFGGVMVLPWLAAIAVEWIVVSHVFRVELRGSVSAAGERSPPDAATAAQPLPVFALAVLAAALVGFGLSSLIGIAPVWCAGDANRRQRRTEPDLYRVAGSLATLLWRRVVHAHAQATDLVQFTRLDC